MTLKISSVDLSRSRQLQVTARDLAGQLARVGKAHDKGLYEEAIEACTFVDRHQFQYLDTEEARLAAKGFVDGLWEKDNVEFECLKHGEIDAEALAEADYSPVRGPLRQRAAVIGADPQYAVEKAKAWKRHKTGGDYWTPFLMSQVYELRSIFGDRYPEKPRAGQSGPGPDPIRYLLAFELHDMKTETDWRQGIDAMVPYFAKILDHYRTHESN